MKIALLPAVTAILLAICAGPSGARPVRSTETKPNPADFSTRIDNPWFPLRLGTRYVYRGFESGKPSRDVVTVTAKTKTIEGVRCRAVSDLLYLAGSLGERTTDWYAQDKAGSVWYFGEATAELNAKGKVTSTEGSWQAGVGGGKPGILMPGRPRVGQRFRQEYYKGQAEDHAEVLSVTASVRTPVSSSRRALLTKEWTPLEPGVVDHKLYVRGTGLVRERTVKGPAGGAHFGAESRPMKSSTRPPRRAASPRPPVPA